MQYMLLIHNNKAAMGAASKADTDAMMGASIA